METFIKFIGTITIIIVIIILLALPFMWLWNALMPELFLLPVITFWQSLGIMALSKMIFGASSNSSSK